MTHLEPICFSCKHFDIDTSTCDAFPEKIPDIIIFGGDDHKKPLPGQGNKIIFEPRSGNWQNSLK